MSRHRLLCVGIAAALAGCAAVPVYRSDPARAHLGAAGRAAACTKLFEAVDRAVDQAGVRDALAAPVAGFPYLRASRFLASFASAPLPPAAFAEWVQELRRLDRESRAIELTNLPPRARGSLDRALPAEAKDALAALDACARDLQQSDLADAAGRERLRAAVRVPPNYEPWKRVVGVYPLTRLFLARGVRRWQEETRAVFAAVPRLESPVLYVPPPGPRLTASEIASILARAAHDPLGIPRPRPSELASLFATFAPELDVATAGDDDRIGALGYSADGVLQVDVSAPTVYTRLAWTRFQGRVLMQLVYSVWFPARPLEAPGDLYGGRFDGLIWRVTLDDAGRPLVFDSIHNCGCYHLFVPTARLRARPQPQTLDETLFAPQWLPALAAGDRVRLEIASHTHYLVQVLNDPPAAARTRRYVFAADDALRSLPANGGRRSAFGPDGIVRGSERNERYLLWPAGVREPGAMREWGTHATAFVGERHFDDPDLLDRYFESNRN